MKEERGTTYSTACWDEAAELSYEDLEKAIAGIKQLAEDAPDYIIENFDIKMSKEFYGSLTWEGLHSIPIASLPIYKSKKIPKNELRIMNKKGKVLKRFNFTTTDDEINKIAEICIIELMSKHWHNYFPPSLPSGLGRYAPAMDFKIWVERTWPSAPLGSVVA